MNLSREGSHRLHPQHAAALMIMLLVMIMGTVAFMLNTFDRTMLQTDQDKKTTFALAQAKEALIGDTVSLLSILSAGYLRLPDLGFSMGNIPSEGSSPPNFSGNNTDHSVIGKVPWKTLGISPARDGQSECIWYIVSGRFKNNPTTNSEFNWDTPGQLDVADGAENIIASNLAALLIAPGQALSGQNRALSDPAFTQCGGNYNARNYLDSASHSDEASDSANYFSGSIHNRVASNANNKQFVQTINSHFNDRFLFITTDDIFRPIMHRSDFASQITALMSDPYFESVNITGNKGTDSVICNNLGTSANQTFCTNWLKMLLLKSTSGACHRVVFFGGQKTASQVRLSNTEKANPANYLEGTNLSFFELPAANSGKFVGPNFFNANVPSTDLLWCIP